MLKRLNFVWYRMARKGDPKSRKLHLARSRAMAIRRFEQSSSTGKSKGELSRSKRQIGVVKSEGWPSGKARAIVRTS